MTTFGAEKQQEEEESEANGFEMLFSERERVRRKRIPNDHFRSGLLNGLLYEVLRV